MTLDLEAQNFRNLCLFYADELRRILRGELASEVLKPSERMNLRRRGLLIISWKRPGGGVSYGITVKALAILGAEI